MDEATTGLRKATYWVRGTAVSLAFIPCIADQHPEVFGTPREPNRVPQERGQYATTARVRRALGKDRAYSAALKGRVGFEATLSRIAREGF
jgi:hypothetical protein